MSTYLSKEEFDKNAKGLPHLLRLDLDAEVIYIETLSSEYFTNNERQRCIVKRDDGNLYLSYYD